MGTNNQTIMTPAELRHAAEEKIRAKTSGTPPSLSQGETQRLVHELEVHQIELEMQNEELRQSRGELETALEKYTDLYDFAPVGYLTLDRQGIIRVANLSGAALLGVERAALIDRSFSQFVMVDHRSTFTDFLDTVFSTRTLATGELALVNPGKQTRIVQIEALAGVSGQDCRLVLIDITDRRRTENALRESEERLYKLSGMAADAIVILDENGQTTFCNTAAERMFGCSNSETTRCDFHQSFIPERHRASAKQGFDRFIAGGTGPLIGNTTEVVAVRKDGTEFTVDLSITALNIKEKWHAIAIIRDITERKLAEEKISQVMRQQQSIIDNTPNFAWLKDRRGIYLATNGPFGKAIGIAPQDLVGKSDYDIYPRERALKYENDSREAMTTGARIRCEECVVDSEGKIQYLEKTETPIFDEAGVVIGTIGIAHDITSSKEMELTLRYDSTHDVLTGLYNRTFFEKELARLAGYDETYSVEYRHG